MVIKEEFEILISKDGKLKMTAKGFKGANCEAPLKRLKEIIAKESEILGKERTWESYLVEEETTESLKVPTKPYDPGSK